MFKATIFCIVFLVPSRACNFKNDGLDAVILLTLFLLSSFQYDEEGEEADDEVHFVI